MVLAAGDGTYPPPVAVLGRRDESVNAKGGPDVNLRQHLSDRKCTLVQKWFDLLLETYPAETARFLHREKDQFANPVGSTLCQGLEGLYEALLQGKNRDEIHPVLESIVKIRAVQEFSPSQALGFIFLLKKLVREELASEIGGGQISLDDLLSFDSRIDDLALLSFEIYSACREKLYDIKISQLASNRVPLTRR